MGRLTFIAALPRAQWFCEGSLPSTLAVGVALCLGCAFVLVCVHARLVQGCVCHEASVLMSFDSVDGLFSAILGPFQVSKPAGRSHQPTAIRLVVISWTESQFWGRQTAPNY